MSSERSPGTPRETPPESPIDATRAIIAAFRHMDLGELQRRVDRDVVLTLAGNNRLSGEYRGTVHVIALVARLAFVIVPWSVDVERMDEQGASVVLRARVRLSGPARDPGQAVMVATYVFREGKVVAVEVHAEDQRAFDEFVGSA